MCFDKAYLPQFFHSKNPSANVTAQSKTVALKSNIFEYSPKDYSLQCAVLTIESEYDLL